MQGYLLCIDASTPHMALALGRPKEAQARASFVREDRDRKNSEVIGTAVGRLCEQVGILPKAIEGIACGIGPGTFTGTRVAVATAKGLALGLDAAVWALDSLSIFAAPHAATAPGLVVLDARRNELYAAGYGPNSDQTFARQGSVSCIPIDSVGSFCPSPPQWLAGSGAHLIKDHFAELSIADERPLSAKGLWEAGQAAMRGPKIPVQNLDVFYLRASYAEIGANPPKTPPYHSPFAPSKEDPT